MLEIMTRACGRVAAVRGTVLEIDMDGALPPVSTALECQLSEETWLPAMIQAHVGSASVRAIALASTRGLRRDALVRSDGQPLTVPVGEGLLGRVVDLLGNPLDGGGPIQAEARRPLRRPPPPPGGRAITTSPRKRGACSHALKS